MAYKLGSLFDGSGGFPLAGCLCGIEPVWAAEVEPYPIAVTRARFPGMKHLGDISKVNGGEIEPVDIITFGSPCQDLSVAGKRAGLKHEVNGDEETTRSGLFMEAVRIIKEMRKATGGQYPRFALWENVPGAFSSQKGEDFRVVLEELIRIIEPRAVMPSVPRAGWAYADSYTGDGWSLAYRVFDAQYWGVPQRRRRIHLVVDFGGQCAREVLFEREGLRGYFAASGTPGEGPAAHAAGGSGADDRAGEGAGDTDHGGAGRGLAAVNAPFTFQNTGAGWWNESPVGATLRTPCGGDSLLANVIVTKDQGLDAVGVDPYNSALTGDKAATIGVNCGTTTGRNGVLVPVASAGFKAGQSSGGIGWQEECAATLAAECSGTEPTVCCGLVPYTLKVRCGKEGGGKGALIQEDKSATLATYNDQYLFQPVCMATQQGGAEIRTDDKAPTVTAAAGMSGNNQPVVCYPEMVDRCILDDQGGQQINIRTDGKAPTLRAEAHGNLPCVLAAAGFKELNSAKARSDGYGHEVSPCLSANKHDACAVVKMETYQKMTGTLMANSHPGGYSGQDAYRDMLVVGKEETPAVFDKETAYAVDCRNFRETPEVYQTLMAKPTGGHSLNFSGAVRIRYIVRRLTPTECARLQGFADRWGHFEKLASFTPEEYRFWLEVRNTHAAINGKPVKDYTEAQMLTWFNKLHTDGAEYKMWGNGIALPPALYCMQGMVDALERGEDDDEWLL